jgi:hypothetical protein
MKSTHTTTLATHFAFTLLVLQLPAHIYVISFPSKITNKNVVKFNHTLNILQTSHLISRWHTYKSHLGCRFVMYFLVLHLKWLYAFIPIFLCFHNTYLLEYLQLLSYFCISCLISVITKNLRIPSFLLTVFAFARCYNIHS